MATQVIPVTSLPVEPAVLLPTDTCDKCGPAVAANTAVRLASGRTLTFCNHCYDVREPSLAPLAATTARNAVK